MPESTVSAELVGSFTELTDLLVAMPDVGTLLQRTATLAAAAVAPYASCGITLARNGPPLTIAASDVRSSQVDEQQYEWDEGPCLDALRQGVVVDVPDLAGDERWPRYRPRALALGVRSSLSLPLRIRDETVGALNFYGGRAGRFGSVEREHADIYARQVVNVVTVALRHFEQVELIEQLRGALMSRATIDQAIGVLVAREGIDPEQAFVLLRRASQNSNVKLREVAAAILRSAGKRR
ncbi:GAF and ANTAR domain-containing protein [Cryptosporangium sp. NPDC051539]|uniref:GAF and ANTAR domain-containing protein n=1 Tax=Cryptosporangium sp. NPDC051539 TaxID=3363962 RepID=UPI00379FA7BD